MSQREGLVQASIVCNFRAFEANRQDSTVRHQLIVKSNIQDLVAQDNQVRKQMPSGWTKKDRSVGSALRLPHDQLFHAYNHGCPRIDDIFKGCIFLSDDEIDVVQDEHQLFLTLKLSLIGYL